MATITTAAAWIPEVFSSIILAAREKNTVLAPLVNRRYEKQLKRGDVIHIPNLAARTARELVGMTGALTEDVITETETLVNINKMIYHYEKIDLAVRALADFNYQEQVAEKMGLALARKIDADIGTEMATTTQVVGTDNVALTDEDIREARRLLDNADSPVEDRFMAVSPATLMDLLAVERYASTLYSDLNRLDPNKGAGYVGGPLYGMKVYETTNLPAGAAGRKNLAWQREAVALVIQEDIMHDSVPIPNEASVAIRAFAIYGVKLLRPAEVVVLAGR